MTDIRLDRLLANAGYGTRSECIAIIRCGHVSVNGIQVKKPDAKVDCGSCSVTIDGNEIEMPRRVVCIMNKPAGFVCSTDDPGNRTVMELLPEKLRRQNVVPAGRLDKDTEGLLVFSNDGAFIHRIISPKSGITKSYHVIHTGTATEADVKAAESGLVLKNGSKCRPARLTPIAEGESIIDITEGMYHQVKCMFASLGMHVIHLKRTGIGLLQLGSMPSGEVRELSSEETALLFGSGSASR